ncbi:MAG: P63C domain-containing protein [Armatimonadetes bacterium]|nr:P63C domain-containing protein [Armatimonadota bacterium]MBS1728139.1 P63C domain-containing protein [Armatimonadota bacterium]
MAKVKNPVGPSVFSGELTIGETEIKCFVVDFHDGQEPKRLLSGRAVTNAFGLTGRGQGMTRFIQNKRIGGQLSDSLVEAIENPTEFPITPSVTALGYEASILPDLCWAIVDAYEGFEVPANQQKLVAQAKILQRGFGTVGITALVDEATGFQYERASDALQQILNMFITDELLKWAKTFPDEFYRQLLRLRNLPFDEFTSKRPSYFGHLTNDIVWKRLAPGVLDELKRVTPRDSKGRRKHKYFQRLTENIGHPRLREHLTAVIALMKAADTYEQFEQMLNRSLPIYTPQMTLLQD